MLPKNSENILVGTSISVPATSDVVIPQVGIAPTPVGELTGLITASTPLILGILQVLVMVRKKGSLNKDDDKNKKGSNDNDDERSD